MYVCLKLRITSTLVLEFLIAMSLMFDYDNGIYRKLSSVDVDVWKFTNLDIIR